MSSRPEDAVANFFPGLELDGRNLDRRFFPGLVFDFITASGGNDPSPIRHFGARLAYVDVLLDPDLQADGTPQRDLLNQLAEHQETLDEGEWYLDWLQQGATRISLSNRGDTEPLDGLVVWRLVRSLELGKLTVGLKRRDRPRSKGDTRRVKLTGWRRSFTDPDTGVVSHAYQPGELTQSLCSPWQHDFRDCACFYWASNHPDIVYGEIYPGEGTLPSGIAADPLRGNVRIDWLRADRSRSRTAGAYNTIGLNRPFQIDHLEINRAWQSLNIVVENTEIGARYIPGEYHRATPYASPFEMATDLREHLAPLEMTLAIEYLYAMFSLLSVAEAQALTDSTGLWPTLAEDVAVARQQLGLVAVNEMQHLHWANRLLWELHSERSLGTYVPVLKQASRVPTDDGRHRLHRLRPLTPKVLQEFIEVERPSGLVDGAYSRVIATLREQGSNYPVPMAGLAERIASDGMRHLSQFLRVKSALQAYTQTPPPYPYLRKIRLGSRTETRHACEAFAQIVESLMKAYTLNAQGDLKQSAIHSARARAVMDELLAIGEESASKGIGIRFRVPRR